MKKLFLLLTGAVAAISASAQYNNSVMLAAPRSARQNYVVDLGNKGMIRRDNTSQAFPAAHPAAQKSTSSPASGWWSFQLANDDGSSLVTAGFNIVYPDSNLLVTTGTPPFYWWCMGTGTSFDPESRYFVSPAVTGAGGLYKNTTIPAPAQMDTTTGYWVDSVKVVGFYVQTAGGTSQIDTLMVDVTYADTTNAWQLRYASANTVTWGITGTGDTTYTFADAKYDPNTNGLSYAIPGVRRIVKILNTATLADTATSGPLTGLNVWSVALSPAMWVPKHKKVVALTHFGSQVAHPLGTDITTANRWVTYTWDFNTPLQAQNDYNTGLVVTNAERHQTADAYMYSGNTIPVPAYFYTAPVVIHNPYYEFYLRYTTPGTGGGGGGAAVNEVAQNAVVNAYPNPANNQLAVSFDIAGADNATVTLVNVIGQEVGAKTVNFSKGNVVFNTAALPAGVYFYTVEANGQRTSGRVSIAH